MQSVHIKEIFFLLGFMVAVSAGEYQYNTSYFEVPVDHFGFVTNKTFHIRVLTNDLYSNGDENSPIFFYPGNEGSIEGFAKNTGFMWEIAEEFGASLVFAEHRYYGKSLPFGNKSLDSPENAGYLTSSQALADFATLLSESLNPKQRPVIAIGGSYGGMLAAWFRMKYPHLITGAIASSAPFAQFDVDCGSFYSIVTKVFTVDQGNCSENIRKSWDILGNVSVTPNGLDTLKAKFKLCDNLTNVQSLTDYLYGVYASLAMVNYPYSTSFLVPLPPNPVNEFCARINDSYDGGQLLDALENALQVYTNYTGKSSCLNIKSAYGELGIEGWNYQACTEMVLPTCTRDDSMFPPSGDWDSKANSDYCYEKYKVRPNDNMLATLYGGANLKYASNIVFSNGLLDPWSESGVLQTSNNQVKVIVIPDAAHHLDLRSSHPNDPVSVKNAREEEKQEIRKWLKSASKR